MTKTEQDRKARARAAIEEQRDALLHLSHEVHDHPELALHETFAAAETCALLKRCGFEVRTNIGGLPTAFQATRQCGTGGPHIAFLAEYDALPGIGHGCGHNVILTMAVGAFLGAAAAMDGLCGRISLIGTPGEESAAGKVLLLEQHVFDDVDFAMMIHPSSGRSLINRGGRACTEFRATYHGKSAHSSAPSTGVNALSAVIALFNNIDLMRPTFAMQDNVNGIIPEGGKASNIIPDLAVADFTIRSKTLLELKKLVENMKKAAQAAAALTGAELSVEVGPLYAERYPCLPMCEALRDNMQTLGEKMDYADPNGMYGSSDIGNVSILLPAIHDYLSIAPAAVNGHSAEMTAAAASPRADEVCIRGAQGMAMTALDLLASPELCERCRAYHRDIVPAAYRQN